MTGREERTRSSPLMFLAILLFSFAVKFNIPKNERLEGTSQLGPRISQEELSKFLSTGLKQPSQAWTKLAVCEHSNAKLELGRAFKQD